MTYGSSEGRMSPLPVLRERVRVRACPKPRATPGLRQALTPALSRSTGRGRSIGRTLTCIAGIPPGPARSRPAKPDLRAAFGVAATAAPAEQRVQPVPPGAGEHEAD